MHLHLLSFSSSPSLHVLQLELDMQVLHPFGHDRQVSGIES